MPQILVRNLESEVVEKLKSSASRHGRSLQSEVHWILTQSAGLGIEEARQVARGWQKRLAGRNFPDSTELLRKDRSR